MAEENFYLDNPDIQYYMEKGIDWESIVRLKEDFDAPDCPYDDPAEAVATLQEMMADPIGAMAGGNAPRLERSRQSARERG